MNDDAERILRDALAARAMGAVGDQRPVPPLALPPSPARSHRHAHRPARRRIGWIAPVAAAVVVAAVVLASTLLLHRTTNGHPQAGKQVAGGSTVAGSSAPALGASSPATTSPSAITPAPKPVHVQLKFSDGSQFGVGIPVIAYFSKKITDGRAFEAATTVTVNGAPAVGAWYFEASAAQKGYPIEAHFRMKSYWPAHAQIDVKLPVKGLSAGTGLAFDDSLTLAFSTGDANIATVDNATHLMTVTSDGKVWGTFRVSLGATNTPTARGTKVIMEKGLSICMKGPGYDECNIKYTQRLTYGGEYLHAAPWNVAHIDDGVNSSNGCTNLLPNDAKKLYSFLEIGDVVRFPDANGPPMTLGAGYGDWNVSWTQWLTGGLVRTH